MAQRQAGKDAKKMSGTGVKQSPELTDPEVFEPGMVDGSEGDPERKQVIAWLRLLWSERRILARAVLVGMAIGLLLALYLRNEYQASTQLMPPDSQSSSGMAMLAAVSARTSSSLGSIAGDLLVLISTGALFIGILRSGRVAVRLVDRCNLMKVS